MYRTSTHPITGNSHWSEIIKQQQVTYKLFSPPFPQALEPTRIHAKYKFLPYWEISFAGLSNCIIIVIIFFVFHV